MTVSVLLDKRPRKSALRAHKRPTRSSTPISAAGRLGRWAGILAAVWTVWFAAAFAPWMAGLGEWRGIDAYIEAFRPAPYIAWVLPCLLLALTFPVLIAAVHLRTAPDRRIFSLVGLLFAGMYGAILTTNYWLLATVVLGALEDGGAAGLSWLVIGSPATITGALEGIGYAFMGLAALFTAFAFDTSSRRGRWARWLLLTNGVGGLTGVVVLGVGSLLPAAFGVVGWISLAVWTLTFPPAVVLAGAECTGR
jgi:hypothetical protein